MQPEELTRRRPVWQAMSELFLDTEVRWYVPFVALKCAESDYDDATLERIFWEEVFPEAIGNVLSIAGEWCMLDLDEAALIARAKAARASWLQRKLCGKLVLSNWRGVCAVTDWLRPLDASERMRLTSALRLCGRHYFEEPGESPCFVPEDELDAVRDLLPDAWARYETVCRSMLSTREASTRDARAAAVTRLWSDERAL